MANFRAFVDLPSGETLSFRRYDYDQGTNKLPRCWDETSRTWMRATRVVILKSFPTRHDCDSRCYNAHLILLADDGTHVTFGTTAPTDPELDDAVIALSNLGMGGWLAEMQGAYHRREKLTLTVLRVLGAPRQTFEEAQRDFLTMRAGRN